MPAEPVRLSPVDVMLHLRASPLLSELEPDVLAALAGHMRARSFAAGEPLVADGERVRSIHVLVEGKIRVAGASFGERDFGPGDAFGALPLLAQVPAGFGARAEVDSLTLELGADALADLLEDQPALLEHFLRVLCRRMIAERHRIPDNAGYSTPVDDIVCPARPLDLVERIIVLRRSLPLAHGSIDALAELSRHMTEVRPGPGKVLWKRDAAADALLIPVCGTILCYTDEQQSFRVGKGSVVGLLDALAGVGRWFEARSETELVALRIEAADFIDVLDNELSLALALLGALAGEALQLLGGGVDSAALSTPPPEGFDKPPA